MQQIQNGYNLCDMKCISSSSRTGKTKMHKWKHMIVKLGKKKGGVVQSVWEAANWHTCKHIKSWSWGSVALRWICMDFVLLSWRVAPGDKEREAHRRQTHERKARTTAEGKHRLNYVVTHLDRLSLTWMPARKIMWNLALVGTLEAAKRDKYIIVGDCSQEFTRSCKRHVYCVFSAFFFIKE